MSIKELGDFLLSGQTTPMWRREPDIPHGSGHMLCRVFSSSGSTKLFYFGGAAGNFRANDPQKNNFSCVPGVEYNFPFVQMFGGDQWERGHDMPYSLSHAEGSHVISSPEENHGLPSHAIFFGGSGNPEGDFMDNDLVLSDGILLFSAETHEFRRIGSLFPIGAAQKAMCGVARLSTAQPAHEGPQCAAFGFLCLQGPAE